MLISDKSVSDKLLILILDKASATTFVVPGRYFIIGVKLCMNEYRRFISIFGFDDDLCDFLFLLFYDFITIDRVLRVFNKNFIGLPLLIILLL